jgi:sulfite reductase alpha subunit-like flavoprotein
MLLPTQQQNVGMYLFLRAQGMFADEYGTRQELRPGDAHATNFTVTLTENRRLTPDDYERNVFHLEMDIRVCLPAAVKACHVKFHL